MSAYLIVQEALTNALRYGDRAARLMLEAHPGELRIECSNRIGHPSSTGSGLGSPASPSGSRSSAARRGKAAVVPRH